LEGGWAINYTKKHYQKFEKFTVYKEGGLLLITRLDPDIVEPSVYVKLSKILDILEFYDKLRDLQEWVLILDHDCVEVSVILYQMEKAIIFLMKKTSIAMEDFKSLIYLVWIFSAMNISSFECSVVNREYIFDDLYSALGTSLIAWFYL